jgi:uncharacterized membrane protein YtjA (UPF0391 family)
MAGLVIKRQATLISRPYRLGAARFTGTPLAMLGLSGGTTMLYYALMFLVVGLIAGALGLFGIAAIAGQIAWVLFLVGVVLIVVHLISGRRALP